MSESRTRNLAAVLIFAAAATVVFLFHSHRFVATNDEGMILEPAQRMLHGARPYVDFFGYMTPGSYWLQTLIFRIFGISLWAGRLIVILDFAIQCALVFWLTVRIASLRAAAAAAFLFAGFQIADPAFLTATHRWDSATLALCGIAVALSRFKWRWLAAGVFFGAAAWCTPALLAVAGAATLFLILRERRQLLPFAIGIAATTAAALIALLSTHSLQAFLEQLAWLRQNYSAVNVMPYGAIIGGYRALFDASTGIPDLAVRSVLVACIALPAILPIAALACSAILLRRLPADQRPALELLTLALLAVVATVFPRADVTHLAFVAAVPYVLASAGIARLLPVRAAAPLALAMSLLAAVFGANFFTTFRNTTSVASAVGSLRVPSDAASAMGRLTAEVRPGDTLFVYPYMPIQYFATQAENPTRFSFLAPGMMTNREASLALADLQAHPPRWVLYMRLSRGEFLRVFPHGANLDWHFETLEAWLEQNYAPAEDPPLSVWGYALWRHCDDSRGCRAPENLQARQP